MKVAKTKTELSQIRKWLEKLPPIGGIHKNIDSEINEFYEELTAKPSLHDLHEKGFGEWLVKDKLPPGYKRARPRYEAFVAGFLYFFENHVSKIPKDNRVLYFDWGKINKGAELTIFLNPLRDKKKSMIAGNSSSDSENGNGKYSHKQNGQDMVKVLSNKLSKRMQKTVVAPPPAGETDPPPPPPPPPPARE